MEKSTMCSSIEIDFAPLVTDGKDPDAPASRGGVVVTVHDPYGHNRKFFIDDPAGAELLRTTVQAAWRAIGADWDSRFEPVSESRPAAGPVKPAAFEF
jgi:hypothetical protein